MGLLAQLPQVKSSKTGWPWTEEVNAEIYDRNTNWPKISIITPSFNQGKYLEETIRSVLLQNYPNLEYLVIDGQSADDSAVIIEKYAPWLSFWCSERDNGQAAALNKGLQKITGLVFNWLNSDDYLTAGALFSIGRAFTADIDILAGVVDNFADDTFLQPVGSYAGLQKNSKLSLGHFFKTGGFYYHQPGVWLSKNLIQDMRLNENLLYCFDTDFIFELLEKTPLVTYTDDVLVRFRIHQNSKTTTRNTQFLAEFEQVYQKYARHANRKLALMANRYIDAAKWRDYLNQLPFAAGTKWQKCFALMSNIFKQPLQRLNRFSFGRLKQLLLD